MLCATLAEARAAWGRLSKLLGQADGAAQRMSLPAPQGALEAQGLLWRAPGDGRIVLGGVSFALAPGATTALRGQHVALVDDVMTTGATAAEAARTLLGGGAVSAQLWVFARTP